MFKINFSMEITQNEIKMVKRIVIYKCFRYLRVVVAGLNFDINCRAYWVVFELKKKTKIGRI